MANSGPHTNGSQFFILYKSAKHLNGKRTVFGRVVGRLITLAVMEKVPVDDDDRPLEDINILNVTVFVNPYNEPDEDEEKHPVEEAVNEENVKVGSWFSNPGEASAEQTVASSGVGKYLKARTAKAEAASGGGLEENGSKKKQKVCSSASAMEFKDFSSW